MSSLAPPVTSRRVPVPRMAHVEFAFVTLNTWCVASPRNASTLPALTLKSKRSQPSIRPPPWPRAQARFQTARSTSSCGLPRGQTPSSGRQHPLRSAPSRGRTIAYSIPCGVRRDSWTLSFHTSLYFADIASAHCAAGTRRQLRGGISPSDEMSGAESLNLRAFRVQFTSTAATLPSGARTARARRTRPAREPQAVFS